MDIKNNIDKILMNFSISREPTLEKIATASKVYVACDSEVFSPTTNNICDNEYIYVSLTGGIIQQNLINAINTQLIGSQSELILMAMDKKELIASVLALKAGIATIANNKVSTIAYDQFENMLR